MPIYYAIYTYVSEPETYWWPLNRQVPTQYAVSMIWAVMVGYTIPAILMFVPWTNPYVMQNFEALWQVSPMLVPIFCSILGYLYTKERTTPSASPKASKPFEDVAYLKALYTVSGLLGVMLHVYCIVRILGSPDISLASVFWPDFSAQAKTFGEGLHALFMADFWGFYLASYGWLCMAVWDLRRMGRTDVDVTKASCLIALSSFAIGPGATMSLVWYWREDALAKTDFAQGKA